MMARLIKTLALLASFVLWAGAGWSGASVSVAVETSARVSGSEIRLGDLSKITGNPLVRELLAKVDLGRSPDPGKIKVLTKSQIMARLRSHQDLVDGSDLSVPDKVYVKRISQTLSREAVLARINQILATYFQGQAFDVKEVRIQEPGPLPQGRLEMMVQGGPPVDSNGNLRMYMDIMVNGRKEDRIRISGTVALYEPVLCAANGLVKGAPVLEDDVTTVRMNAYDLRTPPARSLEDLDGKVLKSDVPAGRPIALKDLKRLPLVNKGGIVKVVAKKENLLIATSGICREEGYKGDLIRVENLRSGRVIRAVVRDRSTVDVIY